MPIFQYRFVNDAGKKQSGQIECRSKKEGREKLLAQGILLLSLEKKWMSLHRKTTLNKQSLSNITAQLAHLLSANIPLYEALLSLQEQYQQETYSTLLASLAEHIKEGSSLSAAMSSLPLTFSPLYIAMVTAGEEAGALSETLSHLADLLKKQLRLKKQLLTALIYPSVLVFFSSFLIVVLLTFVVPSLEALFEEQQVNGFTQMIFNLSHFFTRGWPIWLPMIGGCVGALIYLVRSVRGRHVLFSTAMRVPILSTLLTEAAMARFARTMNTLIEGGVGLVKALHITKDVLQHPFIEEHLARTEQKITEGSSLSFELAQSSLIPSLVPRMVAIGEEGGGVVTMLDKVAEIYEENVERSLAKVTTLAQPVILLIMGVVIGIIMMAILLPLTDVSSFM